MARPRDPAIDERAIDAARTVLRDDGYESLSMAHVAELAEASAPALYRRWPTVAHLAFDATRDLEAPPQPDTGRFESDLHAHLEQILEIIDVTPRQMLADRVGEMIANPEFADHVHGTAVADALRAALELWDRAQARGEVRSDVDGTEVFLDVAAAVMFRHLVLNRPMTKTEVDAIVDRTLHGVAAN